MSHVDLDAASYLALAANQASSADELDGVTKGSFHSDARQNSMGLFTQLHVLLLTPTATAHSTHQT